MRATRIFKPIRPNCVRSSNDGLDEANLEARSSLRAGGMEEFFTPTPINLSVGKFNLTMYLI